MINYKIRKLAEIDRHKEFVAAGFLHVKSKLRIKFTYLVFIIFALHTPPKAISVLASYLHTAVSRN